MNNQFEESFRKQLMQLGYPDYLDYNYFDLKQWLWEKHKIYFEIDFIYTDKKAFRIYTYKTDFGQVSLNYCDSPIIAEIESVKIAVSFVHSQTAVTPINTKPNDC